MLITLNQLKASLVAFKNWVLARIPSKTSDLTNDSNFITTADIPISSDTTLGLAKPVQEYGTISDRNGGIAINSASSSEIREGRNSFKPIVPYSQHDAVYYGLIKIANDTDRRYSAEDATAIRAMIGSPSTLDIPTKVSDLVDDSGHYIKPSTGIPASDLASGVVPVQDVRINMGSLLDSNGVANIPIADVNTYGVIRIGSGLSSDGVYTNIDKASDSQVKAGSTSFKPIVPKNQHLSVFYGLASASGDTTQSASSNPVGTYTDSAKTSIKTMLGVEDPVDVQINGTSIVNNGVANIPMASNSTPGVVKVMGSILGIQINSGFLGVVGANSADIKSSSATTAAPILPIHQHESAFYGLAKAAGDTTQSASSNAVGTYTDEAKAAIKTMLGIDTITVDSIPTTEIDTLFA